MTAVRTFEFREVPMPTVGEGEVGIAVKDVGICGSDMHFFNGEAEKIFPNSLPFILGHECGGVVYEVGRARYRAEDWRPGGDRTGRPLRNVRILPAGPLQPLQEG